MTTVQELIAQLSEVEDKGQPVIFQYYLKEHFEYLLEDKDETTSNEAWSRAVEALKTDDDFYIIDVVADALVDALERVAS